MHAIPVVERPKLPETVSNSNVWNHDVPWDDGWRRSLAQLPVLWVDSMAEEVTPAFLEQSYRQIVANAAQYDYAKLTLNWWIDFIRSQIEDFQPQPDTTRDAEEKESHAFYLPDTDLMAEHDDVSESNGDIPRILHIVYVTDGLAVNVHDGSQTDVWPPDVRRNIDNWRKLHPAWKIKLWDNAAVRQEFPDLLPLLLQIHTMSWISNLVRYQVLERFGGVYLDTDIVPIRALDNLCRRLQNFTVCEKPAANRFLTSEDEYRIQDCVLVNNCIIGSVKHHPALQDVIATSVANTAKELSEHPGDRYKLTTTGPPVWTTSVQRHDFAVLHPSLFFPCSWNDKSKCQVDHFANESHVYGMHQWKMSWLENPSSQWESDRTIGRVIRA